MADGDLVAGSPTERVDLPPDPEARAAEPLVRRVLSGSIAALAAFGLAFVAHLALELWGDGRHPLFLFTLPVLFCGLYYGSGAAAGASLLALALGVFEYRSDGALGFADAAYLITFALVCGGIIAMARQVRRAKHAERFEAQHAVRSKAEVAQLVADLQRSERHLRSILETVPEAMIVIDDHARIVSFSLAARDMFGFEERELVGENVSVLMPSPDRERHDGYIDHYLRTGERRIIGVGRVTTARRRDGSTFPIHLHVGETRVGDERLFTGFIEDLSERQETQRRVNDLQDELAHVSRVTAMGTLATSIAHELNQPLTAIANYVETSRDLLADSTPDTIATVREALKDCAGESVRAGQIVRRLRDFIARGESEQRVESLARLVSEASALALVGAGERGIEVDVKLGRDLDNVLVDRIQIQQVMFNLIRNAVEAMNGCPTRRLEIGSRRHEGGFVEVVIADSGPGLPEEISQRLFEPFVSTKPAGMGLGLSICQTIVEGHGGRIWSEPSPLGGVAFHFTLLNAGEDGNDQ